MTQKWKSIKGCDACNVKFSCINQRMPKDECQTIALKLYILFDIKSTLTVLIISDCVKMGHQVIVEGYYDMVTLGNALHVIIAIQAGHG